jgi:hypothetical protein
VQEIYLQAARELQRSVTIFNGAEQEGLGIYQVARWSIRR